MRRQLLLELVAILPHSCSAQLPMEGGMKEESFSEYSGLREEYVVKASALLRLYCALVGIASLRLVFISHPDGFFNLRLLLHIGQWVPTLDGCW